MIFSFKKHDTILYNTLLSLSRNLFFYNHVKLDDKFEIRINLMFFHFSIIMLIFKKKGVTFDQKSYDNLFYCIENNLRELGFGDVSVNKKMKDLNKILYDILLKIDLNKITYEKFKINKNLVKGYFKPTDQRKQLKYEYIEKYFIDFYDFCFELTPDNMIEDLKNFKFSYGSS